MSCASPIQASPPALRMCIDRASLDEQQFSFAFPCTPLPSTPMTPAAISTLPAASPRSNSRSVLSDILQQRHTDSPRSSVCRSTVLLSPRKGSKENRDAYLYGNAGGQGSCSSPGKPRGAVSHIFLALQSPPSCTKENEDDAADCLRTSSPRSQQTKAPPESHLRKGSPPSNGVDNQIGALKASKFDSADGPLPGALCCSSTPSPLRRKRPAKLCIPEIARLSSFNKSKLFELPAGEPSSSEILSYESPLFGVSSKKGRRDCMEDAYTALTNFQGRAKQAFFGVFDGHGGKSAAQFATENLGRHIAMAIDCQGHGKENLENAMKAGYLAMDLEFSAQGLDSGACSVSAYIKEGHLVVANAGDCKAVLCREGKAEVLSHMHRASDIKERQQIESLGGYVDCFNGVWRVQGSLAVTRALGDTRMKTWISAEPDVRQIDITEDCEFLILASDGLWDKVSDQESVECVRETLERAKQQALGDLSDSRPCKVFRKDNVKGITSAVEQVGNSKTSSPKIDACIKLIHKACSRGNLDDITVMVIPLANFLPEPCHQN